MEFILEIICLKNKAWDICNKHWWVCRCWYTLNCFVYRRYWITYFGSFRVEHVPKENEKLIGYKNIKTNIFRIQANNSVICGYFCIAFIDFMFAGKT